MRFSFKALVITSVLAFVWPVLAADVTNSFGTVLARKVLIGTVSNHFEVTQSITNGLASTNYVIEATNPIPSWITSAINAATNGIPHGSLSGIEGAGTLHVSAAETSKVATAWQNPSSATNWTWTKTDTEVTLTGYTGPNEVVIPDMLDGLPVTGFGNIFELNAVITRVTGGGNIRSISFRAFTWCSELLWIALPNVTTIGDQAFQSCIKLADAKFPNVTTIGGYAFGYCGDVRFDPMPNVTSVGTYAFYQCQDMGSMYFSGNAPTEALNVFDLANPSITNYVTNPTATGWGATWNGRPVVRLPVYANQFIGGGAGVSNVPIAGVTGLADALAGKVSTNNFLGLVNGLSVRDPVLSLAVDATGPYATVTPSPAGQIEYWFGQSIVQYGTSVVVRLTAGTTNTPALNYVCALPNGTITNYTSYPYLTSGTAADARAMMFEIFLMDTNSIVAGNGYAIRSWTENVENRRGLGRVSWIGERVRRLPAIWESGVQASVSTTNSSVTDAYLTTTDGVGWQMHSHTIPANTNRTMMWVLNSASGFRAITNLNALTALPSGAAMFGSVGDCHAINVFAFVESGITPKSTRLMLNLSSASYTAGPASTRLANCIADASSYDNTGVPVYMQGMTIRIARIVVRSDAAGRTYWIYDRRGQPLGTAGGGASGSGESDPIFAAWLASAAESMPTTERVYTPTITQATAAGITNTIAVVPTNRIYRLTVTNLTSVLAFDLSGLNIGTQVADWSTMITVAHTNVSFAYPATNATLRYLSTPTVSTTRSNQLLRANWQAYICSLGKTNIICNQWDSF
jgi:hypothetical protein